MGYFSRFLALGFVLVIVLVFVLVFTLNKSDKKDSVNANDQNKLSTGESLTFEQARRNGESKLKGLTYDYDDQFIVKRILALFKELDIEHVVVWGHPLPLNTHFHTHSYVHEAFFRAAKRTGIDAHWVPQQCYNEQQKYDPMPLYTGPRDKVLFITTGLVIDDIPQSPTSWYILHNVTNRVPLDDIPPERRVNLQFFSYTCIPKSVPLFDPYHRVSVSERTIYMPWGTNLLPGEFKPFVNFLNNPNEVHIVGQDGEPYFQKIRRFMEGARDMKLKHIRAGANNDQMVEEMRTGRCAPSLIHQWQKENGYIPCRSLKNISYGQFLVTNSDESDYMLHHNGLYAEDEAELAQLFEKESCNPETLEKQKRAYQLVQQRHTYLNRYEFILTALKLCRDSRPETEYFLPVEYKAPSILHLNCHTGCMRHLDYVSDKLGWKLKHVNLLQEVKSNKVYNMTLSRADEYWLRYKDKIMACEVVITSDTAPVSRIVLQHLDEFQGKVIVWVCNRFDYSHDGYDVPVDNPKFPDRGWYDLLVRVTREHGDRVRVVSYTKLERIYSTEKGVFWDGPYADAVLRPAGNIIESPPEKSAIPPEVSARKSEYLFIPPYSNDEALIDFDFLEKNNILHYRGRYNGPDDLTGFKGILHIPYAPSNLALFEFLLRGIVYYIPSETFQRELLKKNPWFSGGVERFHVSEWYDRKNRHLFVYFDSWDDLKSKVESNAHEPLVDVTKSWAQIETRNSLCLWSTLVTQ